MLVHDGLAGYGAGMRTFLLAGAGRQASAVAALLLEQFEETRVVLVDRDEGRLAASLGLQRAPGRAEAHRLDLPAQLDQALELLEPGDVVVSCLPYFLNEAVMQAAVSRRCHFCDLGGNQGTVLRQLSCADACREAGVGAVPDCGVAPGTASVLAEYWRDQWAYESVALRCGGLPQHPRNRLRYQLTFSAWGLLNEYLDDCEVARGGKVVTVPGLSDLETIDDLPLSGTFEAFATSGGASIAPRLYARLGVDYEYKTIRYPGHRDLIAAMHELGWFDEQQPATRGDGQPLDASLREVAVGVLERAMPSDRQDLLVLRVEVRGQQAGTRWRGRIDLLDYADDRFTAMERTTGFSAAIVAALLGGLYEATVPPGAWVPFQVVPAKLLIREHERAGVTGFTISTEPASE